MPTPSGDGPRSLLFLLGGALAAGLVLASCDRPCERIQKRLEACAASEPLAERYKEPRVRAALRLRCRRAAPGPLRACLAVKGCDELRACLAKSFAAPQSTQGSGRAE